MDEALVAARHAVADLQRCSAWAASSNDCVAMIDGVHTLVTQLTGIAAAFAAEVDGRSHAGKSGATSTKVWLRDHLRISVHAPGRLLALGTTMEARPAIAAAVNAGVVGVEQALVIASAFADLPHDVDPATIDACENALIERACSWEPGVLRTIGERILAHVAPGVGEESLRRELERDEERAHQTRGFTMTPQGHGIVRLSGSLDAESAAIITAAIEPLCRPVRGAGGLRDPRPPAQRRADALTEVCQLASATPNCRRTAAIERS